MAGLKANGENAVEYAKMQNSKSEKEKQVFARFAMDSDERGEGDIKRNSSAEQKPYINLSIENITELLPKERLETLTSGFDARPLMKIFSDADLVNTAKSFLKNDLNVSRTAKALYMHRNTLMYRLNKIKNIIGLDIKNFDEAITFKILAVIYGLM